MNRDKQIEEMRKDVYEAINHNRVIDVTHDCFIDVNTIGLTKELYDDGYRKASEVAGEIFAEIEKSIANLEYQAKTPRKTVKVEELKAQCDWILHEVIPKALAELKKKYTENKGE